MLLEGRGSRDEIERAALRLRRAFEAPFTTRDQEFPLSVSIGVADSELEHDRIVTERLQRETALRRALREGQLTAHFQPVCRLSTGRIVGAEALVRWRHPGRGLIHPGEFIPLAERVETVAQCRWLREAGCPEARGCHFARPGPAEAFERLLEEGLPAERFA